jgi:hypothetical protein
MEKIKLFISIIVIVIILSAGIGIILNHNAHSTSSDPAHILWSTPPGISINSTSVKMTSFTMNETSVYISNMTVNQKGKFNLSYISDDFYNTSGSFWVYIFNRTSGMNFISKINGSIQDSSYLRTEVEYSLFACHFPASSKYGNNGQHIIGETFGYSAPQGNTLEDGSYMFVLVNPAFLTIHVSPEVVISL